MAKRRAITEEEKRRKELIKELLKTTPLRDGQDLNDIMKEFIAEMVNGSLEGELNDELGYDKYDVGNKETAAFLALLMNISAVRIGTALYNRLFNFGCDWLTVSW